MRLGVTDAQQQAMLAESQYGLHVTAADPDHQSNAGATLRSVDVDVAPRCGMKGGLHQGGVRSFEDAVQEVQEVAIHLEVASDVDGQIDLIG